MKHVKSSAVTRVQLESLATFLQRWGEKYEESASKISRALNFFTRGSEEAEGALYGFLNTGLLSSVSIQFSCSGEGVQWVDAYGVPASRPTRIEGVAPEWTLKAALPAPGRNNICGCGVAIRFIPAKPVTFKIKTDDDYWSARLNLFPIGPEGSVKIEFKSDKKQQAITIPDLSQMGIYNAYELE